MLRKSFAFILLILITCALTFAQETSKSKETKKKKEAARSYSTAFNFAFGGGGSYLGVQTKEVTKDNFSKYGLSSVRGVAVEKVIKDSPAEKAGLKDGDVIVRFNGESVTSTRKLRRLISEVAPDHTAAITVVRNGSERNINATIGKSRGRVFSTGSFPNGFIVDALPRVGRVPNVRVSPNIRIFPKRFGENFTLRFGSSRLIGIGVSSLSKQLGEHFGVADGKGILINNVRKDSPAAKAGLRAGDVIVEADGKEIKNSFDLTRIINNKKDGAVNLTIVRNKNRQNISVTPEKRKGNSFYLKELKQLEKTLKEVEKIRVAPSRNFTIRTRKEIL